MTTKWRYKRNAGAPGLDSMTDVDTARLVAQKMIDAGFVYDSYTNCGPAFSAKARDVFYSLAHIYSAHGKLMHPHGLTFNDLKPGQRGLNMLYAILLNNELKTRELDDDTRAKMLREINEHATGNLSVDELESTPTILKGGEIFRRVYSRFATP